MEVARILQTHVPAAAVAYCTSLWQQLPFDLKLRKKRLTKIGDFTCGTGRRPQITINNNLHPCLFLMTYVHEVAHWHTHRAHGHRAEAHGKEWQQVFQQLMAPLLTETYFPEPLLTVLRKHMAQPKASSYSDAELTQAFRNLDEKEKSAVLLSHIPEGSIFHLNGRWFTKGKIRRTRVVCREVKSRRQYLVPIDMPVENAQLSLLDLF